MSLGFVIPGTIGLLSQIAPNVPLLWRGSFAIAGVAGAIGMFLLARTGHVTCGASDPCCRGADVRVGRGGGAVTASALDLTALQVEAILLSLLVFLGAQAAWAVAMAPRAR